MFSSFDGFVIIQKTICCRYTGIEIELITDPTLFLMVENSIRGGLSVVTHKYVKANNEYLADYNPDESTSFCMYLDANNLYGWAMSQMMPYKGMRWLSEDEIANLDCTRIDENCRKGYILEVDLTYPKELHDSHSDFPCAPTKRCVMPYELSPYSQELIARESVIKSKGQKSASSSSLTQQQQQQQQQQQKHSLSSMPSTSAKLIADLHDKQRYVLHCRNLKLYLRLGLQLEKVHRVIEFEQSPWLRKYIELNTEKRKEAKNSFEKDFFKLMNNSVFGKTMENTRNRIDLSLVNCPERLAKLTKLPRFQRTNIINESLVSVKCLTTTVKLNKPIYIGFAILELSKILMYEFHYDVIQKRYGNKAKLCFTDTDSLFYWIQTEDIYRDMQSERHCYDTSAYPLNHPLFSTENKKVLGKMKDEMAGDSISEFVGLRSKMYSLKTSGAVEKRTAKGVKKATIRKCLRHAMYVECLWSGKTSRELMRSIRTYNHQIFSTVQRKVTLSSFDDKRYVLNDKFTTRAHGHFQNKLCNFGEHMDFANATAHNPKNIARVNALVAAADAAAAAAASPTNANSNDAATAVTLNSNISASKLVETSDSATLHK